jgi:hypothetical protein
MFNFLDSFDHYSTADILKKWTSKSGSVEITSVHAIIDQCAKIPAGTTLARAIVTESTRTWGGAHFYFDDIADADYGIGSIFLRVETAELTQFDLRLHSDGRVGLFSEDVLITESAAGAVESATHVHIGYDVTIGPANDAAVFINGVTLAIVDPVDVHHDSSPADQPDMVVYVAPSFTDVYIDNVFVGDWANFQTGSSADAPRVFPGICDITCVQTAADSGLGVSSWASSSGADWQAVGELRLNTTAYISNAGSSSNDELFLYDAPPTYVDAPILCAALTWSWLKTDGGAVGTFAPTTVSLLSGFSIGSPDMENYAQLNADIVPTEEKFVQAFSNQDPATNDLWTEASLAVAELGWIYLAP